MSQPALFAVPLSPSDVRDCWRTPRGVLMAPLDLLGRARYDVDAAGEHGLNPLADRVITSTMDGLTTPWTVPGVRRPLVWCNPPFSKAGGGKVEWVRRAWSQSRAGCIVALLLPAWGDQYAAWLDSVCSARIGLCPRVEFVPPPGVKASSPNQVAHAVWILGLAGSLGTLGWDWTRERWLRAADGPAAGGGA